MKPIRIPGLYIALLCSFFTSSVFGQTSSFSLDPTFSGNSNDIIRVSDVQSDGSIIIAGHFTMYDSTEVGYIARLNTDGSLDTSFNTGGEGANAIIGDIEVLPDDKILVGGSFTSFNGIPVNYVTKLNADGSLDTAFSDSVVTDATFINATVPTIVDMEVQPDGKIIILGFINEVDGIAKRRMARINPDGSLDNSFTFGVTGGGVFSLFRKNLALQPDGKLIFGAGVLSLNGQIVDNLVRLNPDGSLDNTFVGGTRGTIGQGNGTGYIYSVALQPDGKVIIVGDFTEVNGTSRPTVARLNSDGTLDDTFDPGIGPDRRPFCVEVLSNGKIMIGGEFDIFNEVSLRTSFVLLNEDGSINNAFEQVGAEGFVSGNIFDFTEQSDGKILASGQFTFFKPDDNDLSGILRIGEVLCNAAVNVANLSLNGAGSEATVNPGATVSLSVDYSLANPADCLDCTRQIVLGIDSTAIGCAYDGVPLVCPDSTQGSYSTSFVAPTEPGTYAITTAGFYESTCGDALAAFSGSDKMELGILTVTCEDIDILYEQDIATSATAPANAVFLAAGQSFTAQSDYNEVAGIFLNMFRLESNNYTLNLYSGSTPPPPALPGTPIATATLNLSEENDLDCCAPDGNGLPIYFEFDSSVSLTSGTNYYFLMNPVVDTTVNVITTQFITAPGSTIPGSYISLTADGIGGEFRNIDLSFGFFQRCAVVEPCTATEAVTNLSLNGGGMEATVAPGATVTLSVDYSLANPADCLDCTRQIVLGIDSTAIGCAYDGVPLVCPDSTQGTYNVSFIAPTEPGTYAITTAGFYESTCGDALAAFGAAEKTVLGSLTVLCNSTSSVANVSLNGGNDSLSITPAQGDSVIMVNLTLDYSLSNGTDCPDCMRQLVIGFEEEGLACVYDDVPSVCPAILSESYSGTINVPAIPGVYNIYWADFFESSCTDAIEKFPTADQTLIARITIDSVVTKLTSVERLSTFAKVYPNPTSNSLIIEKNQGSFQDVEIKLSNLLGQTLLKQNYPNSQLVKQVINLEGMAEGVYLLQLRSGNRRYVEKIVISK